MKTSRRSFLGAASALSAFVVSPFGRTQNLGAVEVRRDGGPASPMQKDAGSPAPMPRDGGTPAPPPSEGLVKLARDRYGKYLDEQQLKMLDAKLGEVEARSNRLHSFKLKNGDEPSTRFRAVQP